jgi:hypothetical protein
MYKKLFLKFLLLYKFTWWETEFLVWSSLILAWALEAMLEKQKLKRLFFKLIFQVFNHRAENKLINKKYKYFYSE